MSSRWPGPGHQSDPLDPRFTRRPFWLDMVFGAIGGAVLVAIVVYALVR